MIKDCSVQCDNPLDPETEAEMAERYKDTDEIIYPSFLAALNRAKIDYNIAADSTTDMRTRIDLCSCYIRVLLRGTILSRDGGPIIREICVNRPKLILVLEHSAYLTIAWLRLMNQLQMFTNSNVNNYWFRDRLESEYIFLEEIKRIWQDYCAAGFAKK